MKMNRFRIICNFTSVAGRCIKKADFEDFKWEYKCRNAFLGILHTVLEVVEVKGYKFLDLMAIPVGL